MLLFYGVIVRAYHRGYLDGPGQIESDTVRRVDFLNSAFVGDNMPASSWRGYEWGTGREDMGASVLRGRRNQPSG